MLDALSSFVDRQKKRIKAVAQKQDAADLAG
jgi:hypothetical protein